MIVTAPAAFVFLAACGSGAASPSPLPVVQSTSATAPVGVAPPIPALRPASMDTRMVRITFYGAHDNDPPGSTTIDNPVIHKTAGGVGSYTDPLTFASPTGVGAYPAGSRIYVPLVQKYFIHEDSCEVSWTATSGCGAVSHVDLYMGNPSDSKTVLKCEDALTPDGQAQIVVNPPPDLPYDPVPLWVQSTQTCHVR